ncbi:MAG: XdhC family protein, partial [Psychrobacter sp.]|nr:XdhC family protein [Psychrobacter sp.]
YEDEDNDEEESYDSMSFGLGCHGSIHVLFERLSTAKAFLATLKSVRNAEQPVGVATLLAMTPTTVNDSSFDIDHTKPKNESGELTCGARFSLTPSSAEISLLNDVPLRLLSELNRPKNSSLLQQLQVAIDGLRLKSGAKARYQHIHYSDEQFSYDWLVQYLIPPIHLVICGAGNDAVPLVKLAKMLDWRISIIDSRSHYATRARFMDADLVQVVALDDQETLQRLSKGAAVALMSHSLTQDRARLKALLPLPNHHWAYLGQLGPRYRTERLINEIAQSLPNPAILRQGITRLQFPIGYKLGGDGPEALALGIIAQISAVMYEQDTVSPDLVAESLPLSAGAAAF